MKFIVKTVDVEFESIEMPQDGNYPYLGFIFSPNPTSISQSMLKALRKQSEFISYLQDTLSLQILNISDKEFDKILKLYKKYDGYKKYDFLQKKEYPFISVEFIQNFNDELRIAVNDRIYMGTKSGITTKQELADLYKNYNFSKSICT